MVVRPKSVRGDQVLMTIENAISKAPDATWVLINPLLEDTVDSYTFGLLPSFLLRLYLSGLLCESVFCVVVSD